MRSCILIRYRFTNKRHSSTMETIRLPRHARPLIVNPDWLMRNLLTVQNILVPRGHAPFGQHQESRPLAVSNNGSPRLTDFPSLCACSESSLTNLIGSGLNLLCLQIHSKPECRWTWPGGRGQLVCAAMGLRGR